MSPVLRWFLVGAALASVMSAAIFWMVTRRSVEVRGDDAEAVFARAVNLEPLARSAVHHEGRLKSFDSFAVEIMGMVSGRKRLFDQPHSFTYLDMIIRAQRYADEPVIYLKQKGMRAELGDALEAAGAVSAEENRLLLKTGMISEPLLRHPRSEDLMARWAADVVRTAKHVDSVQGARELRTPGVLLALLRMVPPPSGRADREWLSLSEVWSPFPTMHASEDHALRGLDAEKAASLRVALMRMSNAWRARDAETVNASVAEVAALLPRIAPALYPEPARMALQSWYFRASNMTWVWLVYLTSIMLLLMSVVYRWEAARGLGLGFFGVALLLHTAALLWRWYVSGRWPNSNMFEAVTTSVWFGAVAAVWLEVLARRSPMRNLFALGAAAASMCAMMAAQYIPQLSPTINNMMPVLHDMWLYIHTNVIIASYALIAMAAVTALLYLARRVLGGSPEYARVGGAAALMESADGVGRSAGAGEVFDGATMVLMELAFVLLWAGIVMGAIWADHSWGRPWGWDPKEVFALNTFLVFLILVHVRLKARDKGLWTALLALVGCGVMLFNWIVINFVISGLHSYA